MTAQQRAAWCLSALSGVALFAAFPPLEWSNIAYIALIPFLFALRMHPKAAGRMSYLAGICFWMPSLWFLTPVTYAGAFTLGAYCSLYWIPVGLVWCRAIAGCSSRTPWRGVAVCIGASAWWCVWEWARGWLLTGFPWNPVGVSQFENLALIQLAGWAGTTAVSFVVVSMNVGIALGLFRLLEGKHPDRARTAHPEVYLPIILLVTAFVMGMRSVRELNVLLKESDTLRVSVIQPNLHEKWTREVVDETYRRLGMYTDLALSTRPELVIWPETAIPDLLPDSERAQTVVAALTKDVPLVIGSLEYESGEPPDLARYYNSSFLVRGGELSDVYRKRHLVMFGEYTPLSSWFPFLESMSPLEGDVSPGDEVGIFELAERNLNLGMLICFEDLMPHLAQDLRDADADLFVVQTNDGWFDPYWGSYAHMAHSVFRCVEQGIPMVRCGNTGVSCIIDARGHVLNRFPHGKAIDGPGLANFEIPLAQRAPRLIGANSPLWPILFCTLSLFCLPRTPVEHAFEG